MSTTSCSPTWTACSRSLSPGLTDNSPCASSACVDGTKSSGSLPPPTTASCLQASQAEVLDKIAYTLLNPVSACLVRTPKEWPGVVTTLKTLEQGNVHATRSAVWFKDTSPTELTLELTSHQSLLRTNLSASPANHSVVISEDPADLGTHWCYTRANQ